MSTALIYSKYHHNLKNKCWFFRYKMKADWRPVTCRRLNPLVSLLNYFPSLFPVSFLSVFVAVVLCFCIFVNLFYHFVLFSVSLTSFSYSRCLFSCSFSFMLHFFLASICFFGSSWCTLSCDDGISGSSAQTESVFLAQSICWSRVLFVCLLALAAKWSSHTHTRCCSCNCRLATGWCPLLLCLLEMFVVNRAEGGRGGKEAMKERKCVDEKRWACGEVTLLIKSIIIQNIALRGRPATPPPDSQDSFSHNSSDPRPELSSICQPVCDNYHFEMPARHRASAASC